MASNQRVEPDAADRAAHAPRQLAMGMDENRIHAVKTGAVVGACVGGATGLSNVALHWASVYGPQLWEIPGVEFLIFPAIAALLVLPLGGVALCLKPVRGLAIGTVMAAAVTIVLVGLGLFTGWRVREAGFQLLARNAARLVEAVADYEATHGELPESLEALPQETRSGLPSFRYYVGPAARESFHGNPWVLSLATSTGILNWDQFLYYPLQNYPATGHGGWLKRIGDWAYVYE